MTLLRTPNPALIHSLSAIGAVRQHAASTAGRTQTRLELIRNSNKTTHKRQLHASSAVLKNPYYFYDLAAKQPRQSFDPSLTSFGNEHLSNVERAMLVFGVKGSRDASRKDALLTARKVAGIRVPGRPEEPTNCCMSGCIDCVWEMYKEDLIDWKTKRKEARTALLSRPDLKWPEDLLGPEPESRKGPPSAAEAAPVAPKEDTKIIASASDSCADDGYEGGFDSFDDDDDLNVSIKQFLKVEDKIRAKRREKKLSAAATNAAAETASPSQQPQL